MNASAHPLRLPPGGEPAAVSLRGVTRRFSSRSVLADVSLDFAPGQFVALIGKSGSGKSTLLRAMAGLDDGVEGEGRISVPADRSVLFQDSRLLPWKTVLQNVVFGLRAADADERGRAALADVGLAGREDADERGRAALADVGLAGREDAWPNALSGGEQQRVALARSLVRQPRLLLADEPFGALDALTRIKMHGLLFRLIRQHRPTVLLVTHDVDEAIKLADRVLVMDDGRIAVDRPVALAHPRLKDPHFEALRGALLAALGVSDAI